MSERITWEMCPICGRRAALGWVHDGGVERPVEMDCTTGCRLKAPRLADVFPLLRMGGFTTGTDSFGRCGSEAGRASEEPA